MLFTGLTAQEVKDRISRGLANTSTRTHSKTMSEILLSNLLSVFNIIILGIVVFLIYFYFSTGDERLLLDSFGVLTVAVINSGIAIFQEIKAKRALDKVALLLKREVTVLRDGRSTVVSITSVVVDDIVYVQRGDQIVVDGSVLNSNKMEIDESLLTGESESIHKVDGDEVLSGSFCVSGNGYFKATRVGSESFASKTTDMAKRYKFQTTPLQRRIDRIIQILFGTAVLLVLLEVIFNQTGWNPDFVRKISTIIVSLVPQGLVLMATVTFALGVYRISQIGAIVQKLNSIESFANVRVVCMDKTGTLTQNKLAVHTVTLLSTAYDEAAMRKIIGSYASASSEKNGTIQAIESLEPVSGLKILDELPFSSEKKLSMLRLVLPGISETPETYIFGGFDVLLEYADEAARSHALALAAEKGLSVYRNLLIGRIRSDAPLSDLQNAIPVIEPLAVISITDQIRDDVLDAIRLFENHNIRFKILSGDASDAIKAVVREIGWLVPDSEIITGSDLDKYTGDFYPDEVLLNSIFARLKPEHKLKLIKTLKKKKIYTAMIGDGVNDLPAIKEADLGIAMENGSTITREIADIVLRENKFSLLPKIFDEGNKIVNTVSSVAKLFLTKNFMVIYITLLSLLFAFDFALTPRRVSLINIFAIGLPSFIIALKNEKTETAKNWLLELFSYVLISAGVIVASGYLALYYAERVFNATEAEAAMVKLSVIILIAVANFLVIVLRKNERHLLTYMLFSIGFVLLYLFFIYIDAESGVLGFVKMFYEIGTVPVEHLSVVGLFGAAGTAVLFLLQWMRRKVIQALEAKQGG